MNPLPDLDIAVFTVGASITKGLEIVFMALGILAFVKYLRHKY